jgi:transcriptional regulator with XRE-family HTH domain
MAKSSGKGLPPSGFGAALRRIRHEKGMTQKQLAEAAGLHPNSVAKMEREEVEPSWQVVLAFSTALGVDCTAFSGFLAGNREDEKPPAKPKGKK